MQEGEGTGEGLESGQQREHVLQEQGICSAFHTRVTGDSLLKEAACSHQTGGNGEKPMSPSSGMVRCVSGPVSSPVNYQRLLLTKLYRNHWLSTCCVLGSGHMPYGGYCP